MSYTPTSILFSKREAIVVFALMLWFIALTASGQTLTNADTQALSANQPLGRQIRGGETHVFQINLKPGDYARAEVEQRNIDVVVSLFAPDGKVVVEMDGKDGYLWRESVSCIAGNDAAAFQVKVHAHGTAEQVGSYTISLAELRPVEAKDGQRLEAEQHVYRGRKLVLQEKPDHGAASKEYEAAAKIWSGLGDKQWQAVALVNAGWAYSDLSKNELALTIIEGVASLFRETKDRVGEGKAANGIGTIYWRLGQYEKAAQFYEQALKIRREVNDKRSVGNSLYSLGFAYGSLKQYEKAISYYEQALAIRREMKDRSGEDEALKNLGYIYYNLKQYEKVGDYYEKILAIRRETKDRSGEDEALNTLGYIYYSLKQYDKVKTYYEQSLEIKREADRAGYGRTLSGLGYIYYNLKQYEKAKDLLEQALTVATEIKDRQGEDNALLGLRIVTSPTIASTSPALEANAADDGWPLPPLVSGNWVTLDQQASQGLIERLVKSASTPESGFIEIWARRITKFRTKQLSFYPGARLCEGLAAGDGFRGATILSFILLKDDGVAFLNGTSPMIHELNATVPVALGTREQVESYLRFFTAAIWSNYGNFRIIDAIEDPLWARDTSEPDKQRTAKYIRPLLVYQLSDGRWKANATMQYGTALFRAVLYILPTGMVEMADDVPIADNLPLRRDGFDGRLRYEIGLYK